MKQKSERASLLQHTYTLVTPGCKQVLVKDIQEHFEVG